MRAGGMHMQGANGNNGQKGSGLRKVVNDVRHTAALTLQPAAAPAPSNGNPSKVPPQNTSHLSECCMLCLCAVNVDWALIQGAPGVQPTHCRCNTAHSTQHRAPHITPSSEARSKRQRMTHNMSYTQPGVLRTAQASQGQQLAAPDNARLQGFYITLAAALLAILGSLVVRETARIRAAALRFSTATYL